MENAYIEEVFEKATGLPILWKVIWVQNRTFDTTFLLKVKTKEEATTLRDIINNNKDNIFFDTRKVK